MQPPINLSAFDRRVTFREVREVMRGAGGARAVFKGPGAPAAFALAIFFFMGVFYVFALGPWWVFMPIAALLLPCVILYTTARKIVLCRRFAKDNGLDMLLFDTEHVPTAGAVFGPGDDHRWTYGFSRPDGWLLGNYTYSQQMGRNRAVYTWGVMRAKLTRQVPNVVMDSRTNNQIMYVLPTPYARGQTLEFEGDFDKYFRVRVPEGYERDALYFITPELMAALIDYGRKYDMELIDDYLYIYKPGGFEFKKKTMPNLFQTITYFAYQFEDNVKRYADSRVPAARTTNTVAPAGARLKPGIGWVSLIVALVFLLFAALQIVSVFID